MSEETFFIEEDIRKLKKYGKASNMQIAESTGCGVISGLITTAQDTPNMTVSVTSGIFDSNEGKRLLPLGNNSVIINASDITRPRKDIIYLNTIDSSIGYLSGNYPLAVPSSTTYTMTTNAVVGDTLNFYYTGTITAVASGATGSQFNVGANITDTMANITTVLNTLSAVNSKYTVVASGTSLTFTEKIAGGGNTLYDVVKTGTTVISNTKGINSAMGTPEAPIVPVGGFLLSEIYVGKNVTTITSGNIIDKRIIKQNNNKLANQSAIIESQKYRQVTNHCVCYSSLSDGTATGATYRWKYTALTNFYDIKLVFGNFYTPTTYGTPDTNNPDDITIKASIESSGGTIYPLKFKGSDSVTLKGGAIIETDELGFDFSKGDTFWVRTYVSVDTLGKKYPTGLESVAGNTYGEGKTATDITVSGTPTVGACTGYHPIAILGKGLNSLSILLSGDSRFANLYTATSDTISNTGAYAGIALSKANIPYGVIAKITERVSSFTSNGNKKSRITLSKYFDSVLVNYGINDTNQGGESVASVQASLIKLWNIYINRGLKVYQCTIPPHTTSTDSWVTTTNQTFYSAYNNAIRIAINDWIRTKPYPLSDYFDVADVTETSRNSGIWKAGLTNDGLHENSAGMLVSATAIDTSKFI